MKGVSAIRLAHSWKKLETEKWLRSDTMWSMGEKAVWGRTGEALFQTWPLLPSLAALHFRPHISPVHSWVCSRALRHRQSLGNVQYGWIWREAMEKNSIHPYDKFRSQGTKEESESPGIMIFKYLWLNNWPFFLCGLECFSPGDWIYPFLIYSECDDFCSTGGGRGLKKKIRKKSPFTTSGVCPSYFLWTDVIKYLARLKYTVHW